jgi:hypothetical protein
MVVVVALLVSTGHVVGGQPHPRTTRTLPLRALLVPVSVPQPDPSPADPDRCLSLAFAQFLAIPHVTTYTLTVRNAVLGADQTWVGPPFDDDVTSAWISTQAPAGTHRFLLGSFSSGEGCGDAEAQNAAKFTRLRLKGRLRCSTNSRAFRPRADDDDVLCPEPGELVVRGGRGDDVIVLPFSEAIERAFGGDGNDFIITYGKNSFVHGGRASDAAVVMASSFATGRTVAFGGPGKDSLHTAAHEAGHVVQARGFERRLLLSGGPAPP